MRPSFSLSSISPPLMNRRPRLTCVSLGKPLRRLLIGMKGGGVFVMLAGHGCLLCWGGGG